jgi:prolyl oligopeptidase
MRAYSPVHSVKDGIAYPPVMLTAGNKDPRVDAYHARKMAARLQAASSSKSPIILRVSDSGHGMGTKLDEKIEEWSDTYTFLFHHAGVKYQAPKKKKKPAKKPGS